MRDAAFAGYSEYQLVAFDGSIGKASVASQRGMSDGKFGRDVSIRIFLEPGQEVGVDAPAG